MKQRKLILLVSLFVSACATTDYQPSPPKQPTPSAPAPAPAPAPIEEKTVIDDKARALPQQPSLEGEILEIPDKASPVIRQMLAKAQSESKVGNWEAAANALERGLRIEPRNPALWNRLADVHFAQQHWQQAIQLAAKSNTLANTNSVLRRRNWYLIANAYEKLGDQEAAQKYRSKLESY